MILRNEKGFSIVEVLIGFALLGGLSLGVMQVMKNISQGQSMAKSFSEESEIRTEIRMILNEERFCRVSLAGEGPDGTPTNPVKFKKVNMDEPHEGLPIELWLSNQAGELRTSKKFSSTDPAVNKHGAITITSLRLVMNNGTGTNYSASPAHSDIGEIRLVVKKGKKRILIKFPVSLLLKTDAGGTTTILSCSSSPSSPKTVTNNRGNFICIGTHTWDHHDRSFVECVAPETGFYRALDFYRGSATASAPVSAKKGDILRAEGYWIGGKHGCLKRVKVNGNIAAGTWGDDGCHDSLSNFGFIHNF